VHHDGDRSNLEIEKFIELVKDTGMMPGYRPPPAPTDMDVLKSPKFPKSTRRKRDVPMELDEAA
jgi:hypothetical protein